MDWLAPLEDMTRGGLIRHGPFVPAEVEIADLKRRLKKRPRRVTKGTLSH